MLHTHKSHAQKISANIPQTRKPTYKLNARGACAPHTKTQLLRPFYRKFLNFSLLTWLRRAIVASWFNPPTQNLGALGVLVVQSHLPKWQKGAKAPHTKTHSLATFYRKFLNSTPPPT